MRLALALLLMLSGPAAAGTWTYENAQTLPSTDTSWGHMLLDQAGQRLFIARGEDGLLVWDIRTKKAVTVANSRGAVTLVLVPEFGRAYAGMSDGTVLAVDTTTLKPIDRRDLEAGDLAEAFYEPTLKRVYMITGPRPEKTVWVALDAANGQVLGRTEFNSRQMDAPVTDGRGAIFAPQRDRSLLLQLDAKDLGLQKTWKLGDCTQPVAAGWDPGTERVLLGCRGEKPVFVALAPAAGVVATVPIGRGAHDLAFDAKRHLVAVANGTDGSISVIRQDGPDAYSLLETIATRPMAKDLALDERTGELFTATAGFTQPAGPASAPPPPPNYHPDSFSIITFRPD